MKTSRRKGKRNQNTDPNLDINIDPNKEMVESFRTRISSLKVLEQLNKCDLPSPLAEEKSIDMSR